MSLMTILSFIAIALISIYMGNKLAEIPILKNKPIKPYIYWVVTGIIILTASELHSIVFGYIIYVFILFVVYDVVALLVKRVNKKAYEWLEKCYLHGFLILFLSLLVAVYGYYNSVNTKVTEYSVSIENKQPLPGGLKIIMISDTHVGTAIKEAQLDALIDKVNKQNPDLICLVGDIIDENSPEGLIEYTYQACGRLKSKYGTFFTIGNHELYMNQNYLQIAKGFKKYGIIPLLDQAYLVDHKFYIAGRLDYDLVREGGHRKTVKQLLEGVNTEYPVILLDHQPEQYEEASEAGVDLVLSGHTHNGQLYPGNYIILLGNESGYGYEKLGNLHTIVSSGVGTWGFAMRVGSKSELVEITVNSK
ncbi:MAG: metallophosphoesterase [bacterium]|nr:metallophosphoesterase [bacterium]